MDLDAVAPQIAEASETAPASTRSLEGWRFVRLTDTPIHIVAIYIFMTLVLPPFLLAVNDVWPIFYHYQEFSVIEGIVVFSAVILPCFLRHYQWADTGHMAVRPRPIFFYSTQQFRIMGLLVAIGLGLINLFAGNAGFRYDDVGLSERGSLSLYLYAVLPACVRVLLIYHVFIYRGTSPTDRLERALVTIALAATINGNGTAFATVASFIFLQTNAREYLFRGAFAGMSPLRLVSLIAIGALLASIVFLVLTGAYIYGESVKREEPVASVFDSITGRSFGEDLTADMLIEGRSAQYASLVNTLPLTFDFEWDSFDNLVGVWNVFLFRLQALGIWHLDIDRQATKSIARLNYEFIDVFLQHDREGTAPGLIPGFLYSFPPILNVLLLAAYVFAVLGLYQRLCLCMNDELSLIGKFLLAYFTLPMFENPIDFLQIVDDGFIFLAGVWWTSRLVELHSGNELVPHAAAPELATK